MVDEFDKLSKARGDVASVFLPWALWAGLSKSNAYRRLLMRGHIEHCWAWARQLIFDAEISGKQPPHVSYLKYLEVHRLIPPRAKREPEPVAPPVVAAETPIPSPADDPIHRLKEEVRSKEEAVELMKTQYREERIAHETALKKLLAAEARAAAAEARAEAAEARAAAALSGRLALQAGVLRMGYPNSKVVIRAARISSQVRVSFANVCSALGFANASVQAEKMPQTEMIMTKIGGRGGSAERMVTREGLKAWVDRSLARPKTVRKWNDFQVFMDTFWAEAHAALPPDAGAPEAPATSGGPR